MSGGVAAGVFVGPAAVTMTASTERRSDAESNSVGEDNGEDAGVAKLAVDVVDNFAGFTGVLLGDEPNAVDDVVGKVVVESKTFLKSGIDDKRSFKIVVFVWLVVGIALVPTVGAKEASSDNRSESVS